MMMDRTITQRELRNDTAQIIRALEGGDSFTITRGGVPVGRLIPIGRRIFVPISELQESAAHLPRIDFKKFRDDIYAFVDHNPTPRF
jgi:prevent-host-death family protein